MALYEFAKQPAGTTTTTIDDQHPNFFKLISMLTQAGRSDRHTAKAMELNHELAQLKPGASTTFKREGLEVVITRISE